VIYGWGFFTVVLLLLILAGLPFRQDGLREAPAAPGPGGASRAGARALRAGLTVAIAGVGPAVSATLQQAETRGTGAARAGARAA
jgi:hypothetical protein